MYDNNQHGEIEKLVHNIRDELCLSRKISLMEALKKVLQRSCMQLDFLFADHQELFHDMIILLTDAGMVKNFKNELERDCLKSDFNCIPEATESSICCLKLLLPCIQQLEWDSKCLKAILVAVIVFCASHSETFLWSSEKCVKESKDLLGILMRATKYNNLQSLLLGNEITGCKKKFSGDLVRPILNFLKPRLTRNTWKINACTRYIFRWFLRLIKHPNLVDYLMDVLPPSLLFVDDHTVENKILGVECLSHIIENTPPTELKMNGRADVVYDALRHLTFTTELPVIDVLYPCLLSFLAGQERDPKSKTSLHKMGRYDEIYRQLLWNMEHEQKIAYRVVYSSQLQKYISAMGITVIRHMKRTLRVLIDYITVYDGPEQKSRINTFYALKELVRVAWPRIPSHWVEIMTCILCCIYDVETRKDDIFSDAKISVLDAASDCILCLKRACPEQFMQLLKEMPTEKNLPAVALIASLENCE